MGEVSRETDSKEPCGLGSRAQILFSELWEASGGFPVEVLYGLISVETPALGWGVHAFETESGTAISEFGIYPLIPLEPTRPPIRPFGQHSIHLPSPVTPSF